MATNSHELIICIVNNGFSDTVMLNVKDAVLHSLYEKAGLDTMGQGIAFSLPVDNVVGLTPWKADAKAAEKKA